MFARLLPIVFKAVESASTPDTAIEKFPTVLPSLPGYISTDLPNPIPMGAPAANRYQVIR
jgi:hypothetical protein